MEEGLGEGGGGVDDGEPAEGELLGLLPVVSLGDSDGLGRPPVPRGALCRRCRPRSFSAPVTAVAARDAATSMSSSKRDILESEDMLMECIVMTIQPKTVFVARFQIWGIEVFQRQQPVHLSKIRYGNISRW